MAEEYVKKLSPAEVERHYVLIRVNHRRMFPPSDKRFIIKVGTREIDAKVDKFNRIYINIKVKDVLNIRENNVVIFTKNPDGTYSLVARKEK